jgi:hypothetical protein
MTRFLSPFDFSLKRCRKVATNPVVNALAVKAH